MCSAQQAVGLVLLLWCTGGEQAGPTGPNYGGAGSTSGQTEGHSGQAKCGADGHCTDQGLCTWKSREGVWYQLEELISKQYQIPLTSPKGASLKFNLCPHPSSKLPCRNGATALGCITVPGVKPTSTGMELRLEQMEPNIPSMGIRLVFEDGDVCEVTKVPRKTVIKIPCNPEAEYSKQNFHPKQAWEGKGKEICHYFVEFPPSKYGCPVDYTGSITQSFSDQASVSAATTLAGDTDPPEPEMLAVTGCQDSDPARTTSDCHFAGKIRLVLHGVNFNTFCSPLTSMTSACVREFGDHYSVYVGIVECGEVALVSQYQINCTVERVSGTNLDVEIRRKPSALTHNDGGVASRDDGGVVGDEGSVVAAIKGAVSFKERINYRERFSKFVDMGVGGMKREIDELYRRAFASRGTSSELLEQLGVGHVKGILLYGPPGSGKTLLARTIAKMLGSNQVSLINGPEIISKYLGESEKNLRSHFKQAHQYWQEYGELSDLFVIIIDEIDAICKPRGKTDQSAAGVAYDALVNQLLTLMDGLNEVHNTLVIGLTNRRELLDPALLRPGRFEVQIEVTLPDEDGRCEIFDIHTREMRRNGLLGADVNSRELAANTSRFSGAEIAGVVRAASSYALERHQVNTDSLDQTLVKPSHQSVLVTATDFARAIQEVNPAYTHSETHVLSNFLPSGYLPCGQSHDLVIESALDTIHMLFTSSVARVQSLLLYGPRGSGKTAMAVHLALMGKFSFVKILTAASLMGMHEVRKVEVLQQAFNDAYKAETAVIILDDLQRLVEYVQVGQHLQVSHTLLHTLLTLLTATPPSGTRLLLVGTMTVPEEVSLGEPASLGLPELFGHHQLVPLLGAEEVKVFVAARNIRRREGGSFSLPGNLFMSVQQLVNAVDCACARSEVTCNMKRSAAISQQYLLDCIMTAISK